MHHGGVGNSLLTEIPDIRAVCSVNHKTEQERPQFIMVRGKRFFMGLTGRRMALVAVALAACASLPAQVIDFDSGGLHYKTLTRGGVTIMFAGLPSHVRAFSVLQVAVSNGSSISWTIKPEDFRFYRQDGEVIQAADAGDVVDSLMNKAGRHDVINLVSAYENGIYGNTRLRTNNGYEARRRNYLAEVSSAKLKAAAAASAIAFVEMKLSPGDSTDGAVFFPSNGKPLGAGKLVVTAAGETFEFAADLTGGRKSGE